MTLRLALVIDGDATGAKKATDEAAAGLGNLGKQAGAAAAPAANAARASGALAVANDNLGRSIHRVVGGLAMIPGPIGNVAARASAFTSILGAAGIALGIVGVALGAVTLTAGKAVAAFQQLEKEQATYNAVIRATGFAAGRTGDDIENLATDIRKASLATEGQVREAAAILLTFRSVASGTFDEALKLSQDLAAVGFGSITSAATMMGKALEEPEQGLLALRRVGVSFTEAQKQIIKNFIETGRQGEAQKVIIEAVRQQVGGAGAAQAGGLAGAVNQLGEATNNLLERWGEQITKGLRLTDVVRGLAGAIDRTNKIAADAATPEGQAKEIDAAIAAAQRRVEALREAMPGSGQTRRAEESLQRLLARRAVVLRDVTRAQQEADAVMDTPELGRIAAEEQRRQGAIAKTTTEISKEIEELRKSALQREVDKALREAGTTAATAEGQAIKALVEERFKLQNSLQVEQSRIAALGSAATESEKLRVKVLELNEAQRQGTLRGSDYARALGAAVLESAISTAQRRIGLLEQDASVSEVVAQKQREINLARMQGIQISEKEEAAILTRTRILTDAQRIESQLAFERAQLGRGAIEQRVAQDLRSQGIDPASRRGEDVAAMIRLNEQLRISKDVLETVLSGSLRDFRSELTQGANAWEALQKAGSNALDRLSNKLIEMGEKKLIDAAFGSVGGFNIFSLFGLGGGATQGGGAALGAGAGGGAGFGFDLGGYTGDIPRHRVAGVVHGREFVVNAEATRRHYPLLAAINDNRLPGYDQGGFVGAAPPVSFPASTAHGGPVINIYPAAAGETFEARQNDDGSIDLVGRMIEQRLDTFARRELPTRVHQIMADPRAR